MGIQDQFKDKADQLAEQGRQKPGNARHEASQRSQQPRPEKPRPEQPRPEQPRSEQRSQQPRGKQQPRSKQQPREMNDEAIRIQQESQDRFDRDHDA
ncbi:hypothetical protein ACFU5O_17680 [Streptomyces sp. NPDC057445]|uniref:hypothetical protein n=1 Tax=Streptomyces sp. NPDC057445 TaxID=3346136 RepID=UPI0036C38932